MFELANGTNATATLNNSILANSSGSGTPNDFAANYNTAAGGYYSSNGVGNLIQSQSGFFGTTVSTANPKLAPLASNGGPTQTMALGTGSPAIDAGDVAAATAAGLTTDQRAAPATRRSMEASSTSAPTRPLISS